MDIVPVKSIAENVVNCWLSYSLSQPMEFDLQVLFLFGLQYFGFTQLWNRVCAKISREDNFDFNNQFENEHVNCDDARMVNVT